VLRPSFIRIELVISTLVSELDLGGWNAGLLIAPRRMSIEQDFRIRPLEPQLLHARANLRRRRFEIGVDEDVTGGRGDEVCGQLLAADIV
jgi:hypothetical protein